MKTRGIVGLLMVNFLLLLSTGVVRADGCFVHATWDKEKDINESTQKAVILYDQGREDLVLQVKYEGPAEDFGWLIPVPGLPEVKKGSMKCFYELSRLMPEYNYSAPEGEAGQYVSSIIDREVTVIEVKTVGAYEIAVLSAKDAGGLTKWLDAHQFAVPKGKENILNEYVRKQWYFVAAKVNPTGSGFALKSDSSRKESILPSIRKKLATGELHPLVISFASPECVFPLAVSAINGKPSELSLYVLAPEPLISRVICDKRLEGKHRMRSESDRYHGEQLWIRDAELRLIPIAEMLDNGINDPTDPAPDKSALKQFLGPSESPSFNDRNRHLFPTTNLMMELQVASTKLPVCRKCLPRLSRKSWWLTKQIETFSPEEMRDLRFESAVSIFTEMLHSPDQSDAEFYLQLLGSLAVPALLNDAKSDRPEVRLRAVHTMVGIKDDRLVPRLGELLHDPDQQVRTAACDAVVVNWDSSFAPIMVERLRDTGVAERALFRHCSDFLPYVPVYRKMLQEGGLGSGDALYLLRKHRVKIPRHELIPLLGSTNADTAVAAMNELCSEKIEPSTLDPVLINPVPWCRFEGLIRLEKFEDKTAVERVVGMLRDPDPVIRWRVRQSLRLQFQVSFGPDPGDYERWWAQNKASFVPRAVELRRGPARPVVR